LTPCSPASAWNTAPGGSVSELEVEAAAPGAQLEAQRPAVVLRRDAIREARAVGDAARAVALERARGAGPLDQIDGRRAAVRAGLEHDQPVHLAGEQLVGNPEMALELCLHGGQLVVVVRHRGLVDVRHHDVAGLAQGLEDHARLLFAHARDHARVGRRFRVPVAK
jgi:hypothetical protein